MTERGRGEQGPPPRRWLGGTTATPPLAGRAGAGLPFAPGGRRQPPGHPGGGGGGGASGGLLEGLRCSSLCTARACCHLLQLLLGLLVAVCGSASSGSVGGYTGLFSLGSAYYYHYGGALSGFSGADGEKAQQLDAQFHQLKLPAAQAAAAVGGALAALACLQLVAGLVHLSWRCPAWLIAEAVLNAAVALGLGPALVCYYSGLRRAYASAPCRERENLYRRNGYPSGFGCDLHGAEVAVGLFTGATIVVSLFAAFLAGRDFRASRDRQAKPAPTDETSPGLHPTCRPVAGGASQGQAGLHTRRPAPEAPPRPFYPGALQDQPTYCFSLPRN